MLDPIDFGALYLQQRGINEPGAGEDAGDPTLV
jgi:hypothetical protein